MIHRTTSSTQNAKNGARLATRAIRPAARSKNPTRLDTSSGMTTDFDACSISAGYAERQIPDVPDDASRPKRAAAARSCRAMAQLDRALLPQTGDALRPTSDAEPSDAERSAFMTELTTEHFVLQTAASTTVTEASARASL
jgi:hypothetical protein